MSMGQVREYRWRERKGSDLRDEEEEEEARGVKEKRERERGVENLYTRETVSKKKGGRKMNRQ